MARWMFTCLRLLAWTLALGTSWASRQLRGSVLTLDTPPEGTVKLVYGGEQSPRLQVYLRGTWGTVCLRDFSPRDAAVVCANLFGASGQVYATGLPVRAGPSDQSLNGVPVFPLSLQCTGQETSLKDCPGARFAGIAPVADADMACSRHINDVGLWCAMEERTGSLSPSSQPLTPSLCNVATSCPPAFTGKAPNVCDATHHSFVVCVKGALVNQ